MTMQLLAIGKAAFDRFLPPFIQGLPFRRQTMGVDGFPVVFPNVPGDGFDLLRVAGALTEGRTVATDLRIGAVFPIALPVRGPIGQ